MIIRFDSNLSGAERPELLLRLTDANGAAIQVPSGFDAFYDRYDDGREWVDLVPGQPHTLASVSDLRDTRDSVGIALAVANGTGQKILAHVDIRLDHKVIATESVPFNVNTGSWESLVNVRYR